MRVAAFTALLILAAGCSRSIPPSADPSASREPAAAVAQARVELAELEVERCAGDWKDAGDDFKRLSPTAVPEKTLVEARRKVAEAEHNLKVARVRLKEQQGLLEYARATGRLQ